MIVTSPCKTSQSEFLNLLLNPGSNIVSYCEPVAAEEVMKNFVPEENEQVVTVEIGAFPVTPLKQDQY